MRQNVPRPSQVLSRTMKRPRINFYRVKYVVAVGILFFENRKVEVFLQHQQICSTFSTELIESELLMQMNFDMDCQSFPNIAKDKSFSLMQVSHGIRP